MQETVRESIFIPVVTVLCLGWSVATYASETGVPSPGLPAEVTYLIRSWPTRCTDLEAEGKTAEARRCWWSAAQELDRYAAGHPRAQDMKELQMDWQWRAARLALQSPEPAPAAAVEDEDEDEDEDEVEVPAPKAKPVKAKPVKRKAAAKPRKKKIVAIPAASQKKVQPQQGLIARTVALARKAGKKKPPPPAPEIPVTINYKPIYPH
jgi:hypothetical protein